MYKNKMDKSQSKKIILENKPKLIFNLIVSWGFVFLSIWANYYGFGLIFFSLCAVIFTYPLLDPKRKIIFKITEEYKAQMHNNYPEWQQEIIYTNSGFKIDNSEEIKWSEMQAMFGYKRDLWTEDEICLDIFTKENKHFIVTEEALGWDIFLGKIAEQFPKINRNWHFDIVFPAFKTNLTLLYEKENKTFNEAVIIYYKN
jgi:hypothetical protein